MRRSSIAILGALTLLGVSPRTSPERATTNDNRTSAGTLAAGVLTLRLEIRAAEWHPDGEGDQGIVVRAFAEAGRPASVPGPLVRVPLGTEIHAFVRNTLADSAVVVHGLAARGAAPGGDTLRVLPGETREVRFVAATPGTFYYWGATTARLLAERPGMDSQLGGAVIVDPPGAAAADRVFVLSYWIGHGNPTALQQRTDLVRFTINGKAWPNTERLAYTQGDSVRFRVLNLSSAPHPMHLHGFYFDVRSRGAASVDTIYPAGSRHLAVTERVAPGRTASIAWVPERPGNWLFHCHDNFHVLRNAPLDGTPLPPEETVHTHDHTHDMMGGLVLALAVRPKTAVAASRSIPASGAPRRRLWLVAARDSGGTDAEPNYGYALSERGGVPDVRPSLPGPTIVLKRGEPVSVTVVNALAEPTAVHWHGMELESFYDGVADFSGAPGRVAPAIAPRDSFEARFTPPRAGTFMYHPHADELRQQTAGLSGALLVVDDPARYDPTHDVVLLITVPRRAAEQNRVYLNGTLTPPPLEMRVGERYRLRVLNVHTFRPNMIARLVRDSTPVSWRAVAKDGAELPADQATARPAVQTVSNGETYDFEVVPGEPGDLRFTVSSAVGALLVSMPVRVRD